MPSDIRVRTIARKMYEGELASFTLEQIGVQYSMSVRTIERIHQVYEVKPEALEYIYRRWMSLNEVHNEFVPKIKKVRKSRPRPYQAELKEFYPEFIAYAQKIGWKVIRMGISNPSGYPDLELIGFGKSVLVELKTVTGRIRKNQQSMHQLLREGNREVYVVYENENWKHRLEQMRC